MQTRRRQPLVLFLVLGQLVCLTCGVVWATQWLRGAMEDSIERSVVAQGESVVLDLARRAGDLSVEAIEPGAVAWQRLQALCQSVKMPRDGYVAVFRDDTGALVCHTQLDQYPGLLRSFPGRSLLVSGEQVQTTLDAVKRDPDREDTAVHASLASGEVEVEGKLYAVTCLRLPKAHAVIGAYQSGQQINQSLAELVNPLAEAGFILTASVVGATALLTRFLVRRFERAMNDVHATLEHEVERRTQSLVRTRNAVVFGLAKLAESRDKDTGAHLERIRSYVTLLAAELAKHHSEINQHYLANLAVASSLHDIGKVGVPDSVLLKPGKLTSSERAAMQMHTTLGGECLAAIQRQLGDDDFLEVAQQVAIAHHEQWDGSGYPLGLRGKQIPLSARIVALADVYDALTTDRPYRDALSHAEAREWIVSHYGTHFDPEVVEAFVARERDFIKLSQAARVSRTTEPAATDPSSEPGRAASTAAAPELTTAT